jgi:hypothetical protein
MKQPRTSSLAKQVCHERLKGIVLLLLPAGLGLPLAAPPPQLLARAARLGLCQLAVADGVLAHVKGVDALLRV